MYAERSVLDELLDRLLPDANRCDYCGWPLVDRPETGCVADNCSQRPRPSSTLSETRQMVRAARAELAALLARVEDLELIVLTNAHESNFYVEHGKQTGWRLTELDLQGFIGDTHTPLAKDARGLPILTDEARAALTPDRKEGADE